MGSHKLKLSTSLPVPLILVSLFLLLSPTTPHCEGESLHGSFEAPEGWISVGRSAWVGELGRHGTRALEGSSTETAMVWKSQALEDTDWSQAQVLEGWLEVDEGEAWLEVEILEGDSQKPLAKWSTPKVHEGEGWRYVAVETGAIPTLKNGVASATDSCCQTAEVRFGVKGKARLDDANLFPFSPKIVANGDFQASLDRKGRIPMWSEETVKDLFEGTSSGKMMVPFQLLPYEVSKTPDKALVLSPSTEWHAVSSINYPVLPWTDRFSIKAEFQCLGGITDPPYTLKGNRELQKFFSNLPVNPADTVPAGQIITVWSDDYAQNVIRVDKGEIERTPAVSMLPGWQRTITSGPLTPPEGATCLRAVLVAHRTAPKDQPGGLVYFDNVDIRTLPPLEKKVKVWINQVGYETKGPKSAVIATNFFPADSTTGTLRIVAEDGALLFETDFASSGRMRGQNNADWGWWFWRADFTDLESEGVCLAKATIGGIEGQSHAFEIGKDLLFRELANLMVDFFFVQRCGYEVPGWHAACHLDDAKLPDGTHRDLTGGWHSAGDYNKIQWEYGDGGVVYSLLNLAERNPGFFAAKDRDSDGLPDIQDEARWGAQYLAKVQNPETGGFLGHIEQGPDRKTWMNWVAPEKTTDNLVGTADDPIVRPEPGSSPLALSGWLRVAKVLEGRGIENSFRDHARRLLEMYKRESPDGGAGPLVLLSVLDLYALERDSDALDYARKTAEALLSQAHPSGQLKGGYDDSGDIPAAALATFALRLPEDPLTPKIRETLEDHLAPFVSRPDNPFGISRQKEGPEGYYFDPTSALGVNYLIACRAWSALLLHRLLKDPRALVYATDHLDFILGKNPYDLCMLEGAGSFNPPRYHHRYIKIPGHETGAVPGAIPNGFVRDVGGHDRPGFDLSTKGREYPSYRTSEPWLVHNVFFTLALAEMP
ncbi:MAG: glycoside hydrolase family 9 protein [Candidatus Omnitrophica bacterium]|nr:glycoside hydrolase family 9 protein [Candidatus Omnitrophota bacterium]